MFKNLIYLKLDLWQMTVGDKHLVWTCYITYVTHLHKTSHKSPIIKWQKIAFYLKCQKCVKFFCFYQNNIFGQDSFKIFVFYIILLDFQVFLAILKVHLNNVIYGSFSLTAIFSLLWALRLMFSLFSTFYNFE